MREHHTGSRNHSVSSPLQLPEMYGDLTFCEGLYKLSYITKQLNEREANTLKEAYIGFCIKNAQLMIDDVYV